MTTTTGPTVTQDGAPVADVAVTNNQPTLAELLRAAAAAQAVADLANARKDAVRTQLADALVHHRRTIAKSKNFDVELPGAGEDGQALKVATATISDQNDSVYVKNEEALLLWIEENLGADQIVWTAAAKPGVIDGLKKGRIAGEHVLTKDGEIIDGLGVKKAPPSDDWRTFSIKWAQGKHRDPVTGKLVSYDAGKEAVLDAVFAEADATPAAIAATAVSQ